MGMPDHHICLLRNLYIRQEETYRTGHGKRRKQKGPENHDRGREGAEQMSEE